MSPSLSRDGSLLAFVRGGSFGTVGAPRGQVYVKQLPSAEPVQLTNDPTSKYLPGVQPGRFHHHLHNAAGGPQLGHMAGARASRHATAVSEERVRYDVAGQGSSDLFQDHGGRAYGPRAIDREPGRLRGDLLSGPGGWHGAPLGSFARQAITACRRDGGRHLDALPTDSARWLVERTSSGAARGSVH